MKGIYSAKYTFWTLIETSVESQKDTCFYSWHQRISYNETHRSNLNVGEY